MSGDDQCHSNYSHLRMLSYGMHRYLQNLDKEPCKWQGYEKPPEVPWEFPSDCDSSYDSDDSVPPGGYVKPSKAYKDGKPKGRNADEERERESEDRGEQRKVGNETNLNSEQRPVNDGGTEGQNPWWERKEPITAVLKTTRDREGVLRFGRGRGKKLTSQPQ